MERGVSLLSAAKEYMETVKDKVEGVVEKKKIATIKIENIGDVNPITAPLFSVANIGEERRGMTSIKLICGCEMLISTEYLWSKREEGEAIEHNHRQRGVYV